MIMRHYCARNSSSTEYRWILHAWVDIANDFSTAVFWPSNLYHWNLIPNWYVFIPQDISVECLVWTVVWNLDKAIPSCHCHFNSIPNDQNHNIPPDNRAHSLMQKGKTIITKASNEFGLFSETLKNFELVYPVPRDCRSLPRNSWSC